MSRYRLSTSNNIYLLFLFALLTPLNGVAQDALHEGVATRYGLSTAGRASWQTGADGGAVYGSQWGRFELTVGSALRPQDAMELDQARLQLLDLAYLQLVGVERSLRQGVPFGARIAGVALPFRILGDTGSRDWTLLRVGGTLVYQWFHQNFGALVEGHGGGAVVVVRLDQQFTMLDRLQLRTFAEASYRGILAVLGADAEVGYGHSLALRGGVGLYLDVTAEPPVRRIPRTNPATGLITYRTAVNPGPRLRLILMDITGEWHPIDSIAAFDHDMVFQTGFALEN